MINVARIYFSRWKIEDTPGEITSMYHYLKGHCKTSVCNDFHQIGLVCNRNFIKIPA